MTIKLPNRTYFTFAEVLSRWQCTDNDIRNLILTGTLVPSLRINGSIIPFVWTKDQSDGWIFTDTRQDQNGTDVTEWANDFYYVVNWRERGPFKGDSHVLSKARAHTFRTGQYYLIHVPITDEVRVFTIGEVMQKGVVMADELALVERDLRHPEDQVKNEKPLATTERSMLLTIIGVLANAAKFGSFMPG